MDYYQVGKEFIKPELLVLVPVCYALGLALKQSPLPNWTIPYILGVFSICLSLLWVIGVSHPHNGAAYAMAAFVAITQGILCAATSVYFHQLKKQMRERQRRRFP